MEGIIPTLDTLDAISDSEEETTEETPDIE
jgi:hypothetical protein